MPPMATTGTDTAARHLGQRRDPHHRIRVQLAAGGEHRPEADVVGAGVSAARRGAWASVWVDTPTQHGPRPAAAASTRRTSASGRSSCPTWTASAPAIRATSSRSFTQNGTPARAAAAGQRPGQRQQIPPRQLLGPQLQAAGPRRQQLLGPRDLSSPGRSAGQLPARARRGWRSSRAAPAGFIALQTITHYTAVLPAAMPIPFTLKTDSAHGATSRGPSTSCSRASARRPGAGAAGHHRQRQDLHHGQRDREGATARPWSSPTTRPWPTSCTASSSSCSPTTPSTTSSATTTTTSPRPTSPRPTRSSRRTRSSTRRSIACATRPPSRCSPGAT